MGIYNVIVGSLSRVANGVFGVGGPEDNLSQPSYVAGESPAEGGFYTLHEGDLFTPGTQNWVLEPKYDLPVMTIWGNGFLRRANTFNPVQPPQIYATFGTPTDGIGGQIAGQIAMQPLIEPAPEQGG